MAVHKSPPPAAIRLEGCAIASFRPKKGRKNAEGEELEPPKMVLVLEVDVDRVQHDMNRITRAWSLERPVTAVLDWVDQLELPKLVEVDPRPRVSDPLGTLPAGKNGHDRAKARDVLADSELVADTPRSTTRAKKQ